MFAFHLNAPGGPTGPATDRDCSNCRHAQVSPFAAPCNGCALLVGGATASRWEPQPKAAPAAQPLAPAMRRGLRQVVQWARSRANEEEAMACLCGCGQAGADPAGLAVLELLEMEVNDAAA